MFVLRERSFDDSRYSFGNEFCLVRELDEERSQAVLEGARANLHQSDHH